MGARKNLNGPTILRTLGTRRTVVSLYARHITSPKALGGGLAASASDGPQARPVRPSTTSQSHGGSRPNLSIDLIDRPLSTSVCSACPALRLLLSYGIDVALVCQGVGLLAMSRVVVAYLHR